MPDALILLGLTIPGYGGSTEAVNGGPKYLSENGIKAKFIKTKNQLRRLKQKQKKQSVRHFLSALLLRILLFIKKMVIGGCI